MVIHDVPISSSVKGQTNTSSRNTQLPIKYLDNNIVSHLTKRRPGFVVKFDRLDNIVAK